MDITETMSKDGVIRYKRADTICHRLGNLERRANWTSGRATREFDNMLTIIEATLQEFLDRELDGVWRDR